MTNVQCPICTTNARLLPEKKMRDKKEYDCPVCGHYIITGTAEAIALNKPLDSRFSAWIREHSERNLNPPEITSELLENILKNLIRHSPLEKQLILLRAIERRTSYPGANVSLNHKYDYPIAYASNSDEFNYLLDSLENRGFIRQEKTIENFVQSSTILTDGWEYLDKQSSLPAFTNQAFIAMSFDKGLDSVWENIKLAAERAGYKAHRVDKEPHIDRIDAKIISDIKDSLFMVADVTQQKQGVYFEAGFALGLKLPVIWCVRDAELSNVHFDTRQYNHIVWKTPEDLQEQLFNLICAVIGKRKASQE